jgi:HK97 family phage major capsid protein
VTVFAARAFVPFSLEIGDDWPAFQATMAQTLAERYDELLVDKFSRGTGSGQPEGILHSAANASPTTIVTSTTDGAFGQEDLYATWVALPQCYRRNAAWMMNVDVMDRIRQMGTSRVYHAVTVTLSAGQIDELFDKPVYESPYFPVFSSTTGASSRLVRGDFSNYVVVRRTGMTVELVPHLFGGSEGQRVRGASLLGAGLAEAQSWTGHSDFGQYVGFVGRAVTPGRARDARCFTSIECVEPRLTTGAVAVFRGLSSCGTR